MSAPPLPETEKPRLVLPPPPPPPEATPTPTVEDVRAGLHAAFTARQQVATAAAQRADEQAQLDAYYASLEDYDRATHGAVAVENTVAWVKVLLVSVGIGAAAGAISAINANENDRRHQRKLAESKEKSP
jgi:hypothetical protein